MCLRKCIVDVPVWFTRRLRTWDIVFDGSNPASKRTNSLSLSIRLYKNPNYLSASLCAERMIENGKKFIIYLVTHNLVHPKQNFVIHHTGLIQMQRFNSFVGANT